MTIPKAVLYYSPDSVWSAVVRLTLEEKGYSPDELDYKVVDLSKGENFDPTFLRLNPKATVPVLIVPYENSLKDDDSHYKALTDSKVIVEFLDKSRSALSHTNTTSTAPAPSLTPATIAGLNTSKVIIEEILHSNEANPDTLRYANARDHASLVILAKETLEVLKERQEIIGNYLNIAERGEIRVSEKVKKLWKETLESTNMILKVLVDAEKTESELDEVSKANREAFFKTAKQAWEVNLGGTLSRLNKEIVGPYTLGDQISTADLHLTGWLTQIIVLCGGNEKESGEEAVKKIEERIGIKIGSKIGVFWEAIRERGSVKKIYGITAM